MAFRLSTGLRNALLGTKAQARKLYTGTNIAFVDGGASSDSITDEDSGLGTFTINDLITVESELTATNEGSFRILTVADGTITVPTGSLTDEAKGICGRVILAGTYGASFVDLFRNCVIDVYSGSQPASADSAETGTKLITITLNSGAFSGGAAANGLNFGNVASGVLGMESSETWSGTGLAAGTAGWFRCYDNSYTTGASTSAIRFDGSVASSGAQFNMSNTTVTVGGTSTVDSVAITLPAS